jgi:predicted acylesterase/phospholipase RssA
MLPIRTALEHWLFEQDSRSGAYADVDLVLVHRATGAPKGTREWLAARMVNQHHHVRLDDSDSMARLARFLTNNAVALVLAGGGARGFAHLGVIRALRETGVPVDAVGGSSFGALAATGLARGLRDEEILAELHFAFTHEDPLNDYTVPIVSLISGQRLDRILRKYLPMDIEDLWLPFFAVSSDLSANQMRVHDRGPLWRAIRASASLPGILPPALENGHLLIDGAVVNNLPVDVMRERVRGRVIAVNLAVEQEYVLQQEEVPHGLDYIKSRLMPWCAPLDAPTISRVIMKATTLASRKEVGNARKLADLYLNPPVDAYDFLDWDCLREIVDVGYSYALPEIEAWAGKYPCLTDRYALSRSWWSGS